MCVCVCVCMCMCVCVYVCVFVCMCVCDIVRGREYYVSENKREFACIRVSFVCKRGNKCIWYFGLSIDNFTV